MHLILLNNVMSENKSVICECPSTLDSLRQILVNILFS